MSSIIAILCGMSAFGHHTFQSTDCGGLPPAGPPPGLGQEEPSDGGSRLGPTGRCLPRLRCLLPDSGSGSVAHRYVGVGVDVATPGGVLNEATKRNRRVSPPPSDKTNSWLSSTRHEVTAWSNRRYVSSALWVSGQATKVVPSVPTSMLSPPILAEPEYALHDESPLTLSLEISSVIELAGNAAGSLQRTNNHDPYGVIPSSADGVEQAPTNRIHAATANRVLTNLLAIMPLTPVSICRAPRLASSGARVSPDTQIA